MYASAYNGAGSDGLLYDTCDGVLVMGWCLQWHSQSGKGHLDLHCSSVWPAGMALLFLADALVYIVRHSI